MNNNIISPVLHDNMTTPKVMYNVMLALIPGVAVLYYYFGLSVLVQISITVIFAVSAEAVIAILRKWPIRKTMFDGSGIVTAILLAVSLPPALPWWMLALGSVFAIVVVKHLYGGLGYNIFNPAMMAYVMLIISFPQEMTSWASLASISELDLIDQATLAFKGGIIDSYTAATPLTDIKNSLRVGISTSDHFSQQSMGLLAMENWENINVGFLIGGCYLLARRLINWQIPFFLLGSFALLSFIFHLINPDGYPAPLFQLFAGGSMIGAFFIATDPVTTSTTTLGKIIYASGIGILEFTIRSFGGYPDGISFAVVIMNMLAPLINHFTRPHV